jgi:hypothetical protein
VAPSAASVGDLALVPLSKPRLVAVLRETPAPIANGALLGIVNVEVDGVGAQLGNEVGGLLRD